MSKILKATPHIQVTEEGLIAKTVLMPGDPLRAKYIAETFLTDVVCFNEVRGMYGFTGTYQNKRISVMGSGMGMPSIGIYSYELFSNYGVENIIRIGSCGAYSPDLKLYDVILAKDAYSESSFALAQAGESRDTLPANEEINQTKSISDLVNFDALESIPKITYFMTFVGAGIIMVRRKKDDEQN